MKRENLHKSLKIGALAIMLSCVTLVDAAKPKLEGFVLRGDVVSGAPGLRNHFDNPNGSSWASSVDGIVVTAEWAHLQTRKYGPITSNNIIDQAISAVRSYNSWHNRNQQLHIKLRILSGIYSPDWVSNSVGSMYVNYKNSKQGILPYFWTNSFQSYWQSFQNKLAAKYDNEPLILDIALSGCMTHNTETMWRNYGSHNSTSIEDLKRNGLTQAADERCLLNQIDIAAGAWKKTNVSMAINGWKAYDKPKRGRNYPLKLSFVNQMVNHCKSKLGTRCIVGNNSVGVKSAIHREHLKSRSVLKFVARYPYSTYIQTTTNASHIDRAINYAANALHSSMVELPRLRDLNKVSSWYLRSSRMQNARALLKRN